MRTKEWGMTIAPVRVPRPMTVRAGAAAVPVVSPGPPCPVPSLVIAPRRGSRADRGVFGAFGPVLAAGLVELAPTPDATHGGAFATDVPLTRPIPLSPLPSLCPLPLLSTGAASVPAWKVWPRRPVRP